MNGLLEMREYKQHHLGYSVVFCRSPNTSTVQAKFHSSGP